MGSGGNQQGESQLDTPVTDENDPRRAGWFKGDDDLMVDRLVSACAQQKKGPKEPLPGFGRSLVPYFVPDAPEEPDEDDINVTPEDGTSPTRPQPPDAKKAKKKANKKLDFKHTEVAQTQFAIPKPGLALHHTEEAAAERSLKQPPAEFLAKAMSTVSEAQRQQSAAAFAAASAAIKKSASEKKRSERKERSENPSKPIAIPITAAPPTKKASKVKGNNHSIANSQANAKSQSKHQPSHNSKNQSPEKERWAGGAYANAPAPMNIPLPNIMMAQSTVQPAALAYSQSPPQSLAALQSSSLLSLLQQCPAPAAAAAAPAAPVAFAMPAAASPFAVPKPAMKLLTPADLLAQSAARSAPSSLKAGSQANDLLSLIQGATQRPPTSCHVAAAAMQPGLHHQLPNALLAPSAPAPSAVGSNPNDASRALREMLNF